MKNKIFLVLIMVALFISTVSASNGEIMAYLRDFNVQLDGKILDLRDSEGNKVTPVVIGGTTYLPVRAISSSLGLNVDWNGDTQTVILKGISINESSSKVDVNNIESLLKKEKVFVSSVKMVKGDSRWKSLYPDRLQFSIKNKGNTNIKSAVIAFFAWDKNGLPIKIKGNIDFSDGEFLKELEGDNINLVPNSTYKAEYGLEENHKIATYKAILVSVRDFNGKIYINPYYDDWQNIYVNK